MPEPIADDIAAQAARRPDAPALLWQGRAISYAEFDTLTRDVATWLAELDFDRNRPVALRAVKSPTALAVILACLRAGRAILLASPDLGREMQAALVVRAGCQAVLSVRGPGQVEGRPAVTATGPAPPLPAGTRLLLTTSGSTGIPKIVPLGAEALDRFTAWAGAEFALGPGARVLNYAPLNFDLCLLDVWATLRHGGCTVLVDPDRAVDPRHLARLVHETGPHVVQGVPMLFRLLAEAAGPDACFPGVRDILLTGDHTPIPLRAKLPRLFPHARFHNVYGCTETNDSMVHTFTGEEAVAPGTLPLGTPPPGVMVRIAAQAGDLDGPGAGELIVSTPFQTSGYLGDDRPSVKFSTSGGRTWFHTGDLVTRDFDGRITLVGRNDFQVKVRGVRVNIEEIEQVIHSHAEVLDAAVIALPDPAAGTRLHAVVRPGPGLTSLGLRAHCAGRLTRAAIPAVFQLTDEPLPVGPTGKINRSRLRDELQKELT